jgi:hypothetical protein
MVAPIGVIVFGFITLFLFVHARVSASARPPAAALLDAETQILLRQRASRSAEQNRSDAAAQGTQREVDARATGTPTGTPD